VDEVRVLVPAGYVGAGFPEATVYRARELHADVIAIDGGSTDSGPHYLGTATAKSARNAVARDLRHILLAARDADIPVIVGSCGTSGTDAGVDWIYEIALEIAETEELDLSIARIYSEQTASELKRYLAENRIHPLEPAADLRPETLDRCSHIVGVLGHEPILDALAQGANLVLTGRATDTALIAAVPLGRGMPDGPVWHGAKTSECGGLCTTKPQSGGVLVTFDRTGFTVEPLGDDAACTPTSVAAHMMYENADPFRMREPAGTLDTSGARYLQADDRRVRVEGSRFESADQYTIKLEGAAPAGYQTMILVGLRSPTVLARLDEWCDGVLTYLHHNIAESFGLSPADYDLQLRRYGQDGVLGKYEPDKSTMPREVGIVFIATAEDQATATQLAKFANPILLHAPLPGETALPSYAFFGSPAETERGQLHEFVLSHTVNVDSPHELFRTLVSVAHA
jgi:hypothetical protein